MTVTIWDTNTGAIATRSEITGWTPPEGDASPEPIYSDPVPLERLTAAIWTRPRWNATMRAAPASYGANNFRAGERIMDVIDARPTLGEYDRLGAMGAGVADLDAGTMTYTWAKVSAAEFDPDTHHAPVWTGGAWAEPVAKTEGEVSAEWAAAGSAAKRRIEAAAEAQRMKYLTAGSGKALTYEAKRTEAERYAADQDPQAASYPFAAAEATVRDTTIAAVIAIWHVNIALWAVDLGPAIEAAEQKAKLDIDAAVTAKDAEALAAAEVVTWPSPG